MFGDGIMLVWWILKDGGDLVCLGDYCCIDDGDWVNVNEQMMVQIGVECCLLFVMGWYDFSDIVWLEGEVMYNQCIIDQQVVGYLLQYIFFVDSLFNFYGVDMMFNWCLWEVLCIMCSDLQIFCVSGVLKGSVQLVGCVVDWDVGGLYNWNQLNKIGYGDVSYLVMVCVLSLDCGIVKDIYCMLWNLLLFVGVSGLGLFFVLGLQNFLFLFFIDIGIIFIISYIVNLVSILFDLLVGEVGVVVGYEYWCEQGCFVFDVFRQFGESIGFVVIMIQGCYLFDEFYVELNVLILKDLFFVCELSLSLVVCQLDYSNFGQILNIKFGLIWCLLEELLVCGMVVIGFCVLIIDDLYGGVGFSFELYIDFCGVGVINSVNGNVVCNVVGVFIGYIQQG